MMSVNECAFSSLQSKTTPCTCSESCCNHSSYTIKPFAKTKSQSEVLTFNSCQLWIPEENVPVLLCMLKAEARASKVHLVRLTHTCSQCSPGGAR